MNVSVAVCNFAEIILTSEKFSYVPFELQYLCTIGNVELLIKYQLIYVSF